ncbi:methyl-accepting chemotaxis protein [Halomicroarcula sp. S1AR25-4]|uniref:methyl-accepting chemotaxis protein n=1 Tax=Haloarcula sp. S1AR25-4 TaxID=2950538 RepID=UPI002874FB52|nr:methyl-accepting chemotaxis protein [Halomicroarcula sp. S1AR25-4]MDS0278563.1 methyl-accepting chemotaxis protein [Halomicroarcula sp. S1AR25-4]
MISRIVRTLVGLMPRRVQERMLYEVLVSQGLWAVLSGIGVVVAVTVSSGDLTTALTAWAITVPVMSAGTIIVGGELIKTSNQLTASAKELAAENFDADVEMDRRDELGDLSVALREVRDSLSSRIEEAELAQTEAEDAQEAAEQAQTEAEKLVEQLRDRADEYSEVMAATADGDLTRRMDTDAEADAMARIAESFNGMVEALAATIEEVQSFSGTVAAASDETSTHVSSARETSRDVTRTTDDIASEADEQNRNLETVTAEMNDLSATVEEIASSADEMASTAQSATDRGEDGSELAGEATAELRDIERTMAEMVESTAALEEQIDEIRDIVGLIDDIASQTDVLAINASIEAAHADGDGDGFAVVADEVKDLATQTQTATDRIEDIISDVTEQADETAAEMRATNERVANGAETVESALAAMDELTEEVEDVNAGIQEVNRATDEQAATSQEVVTMLEDVAEVSEQTAKRAEQAATATDEQMAELDDATDDIDRLASQSQALQRALSDFETATRRRPAAGGAATVAEDD